MPSARITKRAVDAFECPIGKDRVILWDKDLAGFGIIAFPSGTKAYVVQFRKDGRSRRSKIGLHGRLTPDEARSEAKKLLGLVESGSDPIAERQAARGIPTLQEAAEDFLRLHVIPMRKSKTSAEYERLLKSFVLPALGSRRIIDIRRADVIQLHGAVTGETPVTANRAVAVLSSLWSWAAKRELVSAADNPAKGVERNREQGMERFLSTEEFNRLGDALKEAEAVGLPFEIDRTKPNSKHSRKPGTRRPPLDPFAAAAIRLLLLTGARLREILHLRWDEVDLQRGMIFLADSKTGKKAIYLSEAAIAILAEIPRIAGNPFVIAGGKEGAPRSDLKRPWDTLKKAAGLDGVRIHDWRHTFGSVAAGQSMGLPMIGKLLGHKQQSTTARYAHLDANPMRRAANAVGADISSALRGTSENDDESFSARRPGIKPRT